MSTGDSEDPNGVAELATEAVAPIAQELRQRLVVEIDGQDTLALETALLKAFINGMRAASADTTETSEASSEQGVGLVGLGVPPIPISQSLDESLPWLDPWAARYGDGGR